MDSDNFVVQRKDFFRFEIPNIPEKIVKHIKLPECFNGQYSDMIVTITPTATRSYFDDLFTIMKNNSILDLNLKAMNENGCMNYLIVITATISKIDLGVIELNPNLQEIKVHYKIERLQII